MEIIISANNNEERYFLPIVPIETQIGINQNNEEKDSIKLGKLKLIGSMELRTVSISSFFPVNKNYSFQNPKSLKDGRIYLEFFKKWRTKKYPFRMIIIDKNQNEILNMPVTLDSFSYSYDQVGDINYTAEFTEYPLLL